MSLQKTKSILDIYELISNNIINPSKIKFLSKSENSSLFEIQYSQVNYQNCVSSKLGKLYQIPQGLPAECISKTPYAVDSGLSSISPSETKKIDCQNFPNPDNKATPNSFIELYEYDRLQQSLQINQAHEKVQSNEVFGKAFVWNKDETQVLYIANEKKVPPQHFSQFDFTKDSDLEDSLKYNKFQANLGEALGHMTQPILYEYDLLKNQIFQILIDQSVIPIFPQYADEKGDRIIITGFNRTQQFTYGIIHCFNRKGNVYLLENPKKKVVWPKPDQKKKDEKKNEQLEEKKEKQVNENSNLKVISNDQCCFHAKISPDLKKVLYFGTPLRPPHNNYLAVKVIDLQKYNVETIIPITQENLYEKQGPEAFMGVIGFYDDLDTGVWHKNSRHFIFSSLIGADTGTYILDVEAQEVVRIDPIPKFSAFNQFVQYDNQTNTFFIKSSELQEPPQLLYSTNLDFTKPLKEIKSSVIWQRLPLNSNKDSYFNAYSQILKGNVSMRQFKSGNAEAFLYSIEQFTQELPKELEELYKAQNNDPRKLEFNQRPLVLLIHGGPHASNGGYFTLLRYFLLLNGYNLMTVNFTGSCGYGQKFIEDLLQNIGDKDAKQIIDILDQGIKENLFDKDQIAMVGGSYGGYMGGILGGKFGNYFKCAVMMNPCINLPFMVHITDWILAEVNGENMRWNFTDEDILKMHQKSPNRLPTQVPTLLLLGAKDLRVPYHAGIAYRAQTLMNNVQIDTYVYPEANHSLGDSFQTSSDVDFKIINFLEKHFDV